MALRRTFLSYAFQRPGARSSFAQIRRCHSLLDELPSWIEVLRTAQRADKGAAVSYDIKIDDEMLFESKRFTFDHKIWGDVTASAKAAYCTGDTDKQYVRIGEAYAFGDWTDNPVVNDPSIPAALFWDPSSKAEKVLVQLAPHFPPALWIAIKPTHEALKRLFSDFTTVDAMHMERYLPEFETMQQEFEARNETTLVEEAANMRASDHFKDALRYGSVSKLRKDYDHSCLLYLGTAEHPTTVERALLADPANPCLYSWPLLQAGSVEDAATPAFTAFRTVYSKSLVVFITRMDMVADRGSPEDLPITGEAPLFAYVCHPGLPRLSGGPALLRRFNEGFRTEFPDNVPVDVLRALYQFAPVGVEKLAEKLDRMLSALPAEQKLIGSSRDGRDHLNQICTTVVAFAAVLTGQVENGSLPHAEAGARFLRVVEPLKGRDDKQLLLARGASCFMLSLHDELQHIFEACGESLAPLLKKHIERARGLRTFSLARHTLDTASVVENPAFTNMKPEELLAQTEL
ncbi:hypothetical protein DIPPA_08715 [Diplonema papillatum]|nr:hypothetical protein DIPPA_08715 [Diplonema papillatum]